MSRWSVVVAASATMVAACGVAPSTAIGTPSDSPSTVASSGRENSPSPMGSPMADSPIPTASGWVVFANKAGQFTFSAPADWRLQSCEDAGGYALAAPGGPPPCGRSEYYDAWLGVESPNGDQRQTLPPNTNNSVYLGTLTGTTDVLVDGISGKRYTAIVDKDLPLPPPKGTTQIYYVFFNGNRTYVLYYDHYPSDPDRSADFDRMVQQTLLFSA